MIISGLQTSRQTEEIQSPLLISAKVRSFLQYVDDLLFFLSVHVMRYNLPTNPLGSFIMRVQGGQRNFSFSFSLPLTFYPRFL